jgi:hypothetical protein
MKKGKTDQPIHLQIWNQAYEYTRKHPEGSSIIGLLARNYGMKVGDIREWYESGQLAGIRSYNLDLAPAFARWSPSLVGCPDRSTSAIVTYRVLAETSTGDIVGTTRWYQVSFGATVGQTRASALEQIASETESLKRYFREKRGIELTRLLPSESQSVSWVCL